MIDRAEVGRICLALPGATLDHPWDEGHDAYKVGAKMFAVVGAMGGLSFKASEIAFEVLVEQGRAIPAPYMGHNRWLQVHLPCDWPDDELADALRNAHAIIAAKLPKKTQAALGLV